MELEMIGGAPLPIDTSAIGGAVCKLQLDIMPPVVIVDSGDLFYAWNTRFSHP